MLLGGRNQQLTSGRRRGLGAGGVRPLVVLVPLERLVDPEEAIEEIVDGIFLPLIEQRKSR